MTQYKRLDLCLVAAVACLGCDGSLVDTAPATDETAALAQSIDAVPAAGEQVAMPLPNECNRGHYLYLPPGYDGTTRFPLLVFLHGAGEAGNGTTQLGEVLEHGPPDMIDKGRDFNAIVASPQVEDGSLWSASITAPFIDCLLRSYRVDPDRVYVTGLSLGGGGTWMYSRARTSMPAAIVPICGPKHGNGYQVLQSKPLWTFHKLTDGVVPIRDTSNMLAEITGVVLPTLEAGFTYYFNGTGWIRRPGQSAPLPGENPAFTVYGGNGHDAWTAAYNNEEMWTWLFAQRRQPPPEGDVVFEQNFNSSTSLPIGNPTAGIGQWNDISAEPTGGTFRIANGRLELTRAGDANGDAGMTRWTDFAGGPELLHVAFDLGASAWTTSASQSGAFVLAFGSIDGFRDYGGGEVNIDTFQTLTVKGEGTGRLSFNAAGVKSALLAADGTLHHVDLLLNRSPADAPYRAPNGSSQTLSSDSFALWVNGALVVANAAAANGANSVLTDMRWRWPTGDNATWAIDNILIKRALPR